MASQTRKESAHHHHHHHHLPRETTNFSDPLHQLGGVAPLRVPSDGETMRVPEGTTYWTPCILEATAVLPVGAAHGEVVLPPPKEKSILEAYMVGLPFGILGFHHMFLGRRGFFVAYLLTLGLLGFGWLADLLRMPFLVRRVNRQKREQRKELIKLHHRRNQWRQPGCQMTFIAVDRKSLDDAYIMWFPLGILGMHRFYLRNYGMGLLYLCTFGLLGVGWLVDLFRMPGLVEASNEPTLKVHHLEKSKYLAQALAMTPGGIFGAQHYYLGRSGWAVLYTFTFGLLFTGWLADWFRAWNLAKRTNAIRRGRVSPHKKYLDDAYILCIPWGFLGLHHFYLRRFSWGLFYLFSGGALGIGWIIDWFRLPCLVKDANEDIILGHCHGLTLSPSSVSSTVVTGATAPSGGMTSHGYRGQVARPPSGFPSCPTPAPGYPGSAVVTDGAAPGGMTNYGYRGRVAARPSSLASYATPAPGYQGYAYPAGYPGSSYGGRRPRSATPVDEMAPPPPYSAISTELHV